MNRPAILFAVAAVTACLSAPAWAQQGSVLSYHGRPDRSGNFVVPALTPQRARSLHLDQAFEARVLGHVYAQPLYWRASGAGHGMLLVATQTNSVHALDATTGKVNATVPLGGKPEFATNDLEGHVYVNIEDKGEVVVLDSQRGSVASRWCAITASTRPSPTWPAARPGSRRRMTASADSAGTT